MIEIKNPWNGIRIKIAEHAVTKERIDAIRPHVDARIATMLDAQSVCPADWFKAYVDLVGPMAGGAAWFAERKVESEQSDIAV